MSIINLQWPFAKQFYGAGTGLLNPQYDQDTPEANLAVFAMLNALVNNQSFAILGGLNYVDAVSGPNYYTPGYFILNGQVYYQPAAFNEGLYLAPNVTGAVPYTFPQTATTENMYLQYLSAATGSPAGATIAFSGNMNAYRYDLKTILAEIGILQTATTLAVSKVAVLPASYTVNFLQDQSIFFLSATVNTTIHFDFTNAVPGTVVTMKWTFATSLTLSIPPASGQSILLESGDQTNVGDNINILTMLYAGLNENNNPEVRIVLSQPVTPV